MHIHPTRPYADGILFDDMVDMPVSVRNRLARRGIVWLTEFRADGRRYGGSVIAESEAAAKQIAFGRGLEETVLGSLVKTGAGEPPDWAGRR
jgi:hypothetical protein